MRSIRRMILSWLTDLPLNPVALIIPWLVGIILAILVVYGIDIARGPTLAPIAPESFIATGSVSARVPGPGYLRYDIVVRGNLTGDTSQNTVRLGQAFVIRLHVAIDVVGAVDVQGSSDVGRPIAITQDEQALIKRKVLGLATQFRLVAPPYVSTSQPENVAQLQQDGTAIWLLTVGEAGDFHIFVEHLGVSRVAEDGLEYDINWPAPSEMHLAFEARRGFWQATVSVLKFLGLIVVLAPAAALVMFIWKLATKPCNKRRERARDLEKAKRDHNERVRAFAAERAKRQADLARKMGIDQ